MTAVPAESETSAYSILPVISPQAGWRVFSPPDKTFTVELPGEPQHDSDDPISDDALTGESYTALDASLNLRFYSINIICTTQLKAKGVRMDAITDLLMGGATTNSGRRFSKSKIVVDGLPGYEFVSFKADGQDYVRGRLVDADSRIYILMVVSDEAKDVPSPSVIRFLNSFHLKHAPHASSPLPGCPSKEGRLPIVTKGKATLVHFPDPWIESEQGNKQTLLSPQWYEIRSIPNSPDRELLFAGMSPEGYWGELYSDRTGEKPKDSWYGINFYAVNLNDAFRVRPAGKQEWERAKRISLRPQKLFPNLQEDLKLAAFAYREHKFGKSGEHWGTVILSPGKRWLAVYSYSGQNTPGFLFGGGVPREGDIYWEVYDMNTGEKVMSWYAKSARGPALLSEGAVWASEDYLIMPFDSNLQTCVIGVLPRR